MNGETATTKPRKPRPEIQIYRPGMLRKSNQNLANDSDNKPPRPERLQDDVTPTSSNSRRRSNDTDSVTSRGGSGSTTPDANLINERGKNRFNGGHGGGGGWSQHDRRGDGGGGGGSSYNSTQSLYDTRRQGGYTEYNGNPRNNRNEARNGSGGGGRPHHQTNQRDNLRRDNFNRGFSERASMRGDGAIAKRPTHGGRRRNDSINSTQSEMPQSSKNEQLHIDTNYDSQSQCGASSAYSMNSLGEAFSFEEMCQNLQSFASMDWSKEVENECAMQREIEEEEKRRLQEANGQNNLPKKNRRNQQRRGYDESDRESSFGGSIAEEPAQEEEEEELLKSGERTPTSVRSSSVHSYRTSHYHQNPSRNPKNRENEFGRRADPPKPKKGGYRGEHDDREDEQYDGVEHHMTSGRLAGRISIVPREQPQQQEERQKREIRPRPATTQNKEEKGNQKHSSPDEMISREQQSRRRKEEIDKNEGVQIRQIYEKIEKLTASVKKRDVSAAEKIIELSIELANLYQKVILPDIFYSFTQGLEQKLFRTAFYKSIESLRSGSNSADPVSKKIRAILQKLLLNGIVFYERLISQYETDFKIKLDEALTWPRGAPEDEEILEISVDLPVGALKYESSTARTAIKSLSRHLISLGDLHRYKSLIDGSENYEISKNCYLKSAQLWPATGHPYNQLGVVVYYSRRVIDEFFFLVRALSCSHPYEAARDRLTQRLDAMRQKVAKYQPVLDKECGEVRRDSAALKKSLKVVRQIWIHPTTQAVGDGAGEKIVDDVLSHFQKQSKTKLHRRAVSYLCDIFGMLVTKVGMDHFEVVSERGFGQLYAALSKFETDFSADQLMKLAVMFIFAVQYNFGKNDNAQTQMALSALLTFYTILLQNFTEKSIILPAINTISLWISHPETRKILENSRNLETLSSSILHGEQFSTNSTFSKILELVSEHEMEKAEKMYPEVVFSASFFKIFDFPKDSDILWPNSGEINDGRSQNMKNAVKVLQELRKSKVSEDLENPQKAEETEDETPRSRQKMVEEERDKAKIALVIHPEYLIPDTNVFIGDLEMLKNLVNSKKYQILVSTTVIDELQKIAHSSSSPRNKDHDPERCSLAKQAVNWLREQSKLKNQALFTLTTTGKRLPSLTLATENVEADEKMNNDDQILQSAIKWAETLPTPPSSSPLHSVAAAHSEDTNCQMKTVVLLTGDRGLTIKAVGNQLPCREIENFVKWAGDF